MSKRRLSEGSGALSSSTLVLTLFDSGPSTEPSLRRRFDIICRIEVLLLLAQAYDVAKVVKFGISKMLDAMARWVGGEFLIWMKP